MALTDVAIRNAKLKEKQYKLSDSQGLYLLIKPNGSKLWYQKYRFNLKEKVLAFGAYPTVSLADARKQCMEAKGFLSQGIDPGEKKRIERMERKMGKYFHEVAISWLSSQKQLSGWSKSYSHCMQRGVEMYLLPALGSRLLLDLTTKDLLMPLIAVQELGYLDTAARLKYTLSGIMRHAIHKGIITSNPALDLEGVIRTPKKKHFAALPLERLPEFFTRLERYRKGRARKITIMALLINLYTFVRSSELRLARWPEISLEKSMWTIPEQRKEIAGVKYSYRGAKMSEYLVPLSEQVVGFFDEVNLISNDNEIVFPCLGHPYKPLSENAINQALRLMGFDTKTEVCGHGFRTMACTALNESGLWTEDAIERQMSHQERNSVRAAYIHKAQFLRERRMMMQWWSDYLDACKEKYIEPYEFSGKQKNKYQTDSNVIGLLTEYWNACQKGLIQPEEFLARYVNA